MLIYVGLLALIFIYGLYLYISDSRLPLKTKYLVSSFLQTNNNNDRSKKIFLMLSFLSMALVLGLRGVTVGEDTAHYVHIFKRAEYVQWTDMFHSLRMRTAYYTDQYGYTDTIEDGFLALCKVIHWFTDNEHIFLLIIALLTCFLFAKFIYDNTEGVFYPTLIFLCESMFMFSFNGIRQMLAGAIAIQAYTTLKKEEKLKAIVIILVASLVHNTALVLFLLFPIMLTKPKDKSKMFRGALVAVVLMPFAITMCKNIISNVFPRYATYFSTNYWQNSLRGTLILMTIEFILIMVMYYKNFSQKGSFQLSLLVMLYLICDIMGLKIAAFSRIGYYFRAFLILFLPNAEIYFTPKMQKYIRIIFMILLILLYFSYSRTPARNYVFFWQ